MSAPLQLDPRLPWYKELNSYHWWIMIVCILGWSFDTMDQRIFSLARADAMKDLVTDPDKRAAAGRLSTMFFIFGWATGGIIFGILGDKWGRAKTMMITILIYAIFTAGSGFARTPMEFHVLRFLTGLGVGGEFSAGVALLAEVIPERPRPYALGFMQGMSAVGNIIGSVIGYYMAGFGWRPLFFIGAIPAILVVVIRGRVKEPDSWIQAKARSREVGGLQLGSYRDLFTVPRWRRNALLGSAIAVVGVTGTWGVAFYTPELVRVALSDQLSPEKLREHSAIMMMCQDVGAFFVMYGFGVLAARIGRKPTFMLACLAAFSAITVVFGFLNHPSQVWWMGILLGAGTMGIFGGFAVYFPELFPTRLRSTGVSFCYNVGRYLAAYIQGPIPTKIFEQYQTHGFSTLASYRYSSITLAGIYFVGIIIMLFAVETRGKPLPTEDGDAERA